MANSKIKVRIDPEFNPIIDIKRRGKVGCEIGSITLIAPKEKYHKYRNIMVDTLGVKGLVFRHQKKKKKCHKK